MFKLSSTLLSQTLLRNYSQTFKSPLRVPVTATVATIRAAKSAAMKLFRKSDYKRWENPDNCLAWWASRTERIANLIPDGSRVLEFGAGNRQLESMLSDTCSYIPSDLVDRGPGTVVCDLNKTPLPDLRSMKADVAVFAGVLEYIDDLPGLIEWLSKQAQSCVLSYDCVKSKPYAPRRVFELVNRASNGYMSHFTELQLKAHFEGNGLACTRTETWRDQTLFVFAKSQA